MYIACALHNILSLPDKSPSKHSYDQKRSLPLFLNQAAGELHIDESRKQGRKGKVQLYSVKTLKGIYVCMVYDTKRRLVFSFETTARSNIFPRLDWIGIDFSCSSEIILIGIRWMCRCYPDYIYRHYRYFGLIRECDWGFLTCVGEGGRR